tara:strand:- start:156 stop:731 length:576 start_codon:yes stop_codon:yes gene_type:complete
MKVGLFFGTFNPVHNGHFKIVSSIIKKKYVDQLWIILTPLSPFKKNQKIVSFYHRIKMLEQTFFNNKDVIISDVENNLKQPNYTINTLFHLEDIYPKNKFSIILGADNFQNIHLWKSYQTILNNYQIFIYPRQGAKLDESKSFSSIKNIHFLDFPAITVSSSFIRSNIKNQDYMNCLNPSVCKYIIDNNLY